MRKVVYGIFVLVLLSLVSVIAGESQDIDFTQATTQAVYLYEGDEVRFALLGGEHVLIMNDVGSASVKIGLGPFIDQPNNTEIYETILGLDYILKLDLDKDGTPDINLALYSIDDDGQVHLVIQDVAAEDILEQETLGDVGLVGESSGLSPKMVSLILIGILVLALVLFWFFRKGKKGVVEKKMEHTLPEHKTPEHAGHQHTEHEHHFPKTEISS